MISIHFAKLSFKYRLETVMKRESQSMKSRYKRWFWLPVEPLSLLQVTDFSLDALTQTYTDRLNGVVYHTDKSSSHGGVLVCEWTAQTDRVNASGTEGNVWICVWMCLCLRGVYGGTGSRAAWQTWLWKDTRGGWRWQTVQARLQRNTQTKEVWTSWPQQTQTSNSKCSNDWCPFSHFLQILL